MICAKTSLSLELVLGQAEGVHAVLCELAEEHHSRHTRKGGCRPRRQSAKFIQLDRGSEANLRSELLGVDLERKQRLVRNCLRVI